MSAHLLTWQWAFRPLVSDIAHAFTEEQPYAAVGCGRVMRDPDEWVEADPERDGTRFCVRCYNKVEGLR